MSWEATSYVQRLTAADGLTSSEKLVLLVLADRHNIDTGYAWPSVPRIAREAIISERHVYKLLGSLEEKGFIRRETRVDDKGRQTSSAYYFPFLEEDPLTTDDVETPAADPEPTSAPPTIKELREDVTQAVAAFCEKFEPTPGNASTIDGEIVGVIEDWETKYGLEPKETRSLVVAAAIGAARTWLGSKDYDRTVAELTNRAPENLRDILRWIAAASDKEDPNAYLRGCAKRARI